MSPKDTFLGRAKPLVLARVASAGLTFVIPLVLARKMSMQDFGAYKQMVLVAQTLYYVLPWGLSQSLYYFFPRGEHRRAFFAQTVMVLSGLGLLAMVVLVLGAPGLSQAFSNVAFETLRWPLALYVFGVMVSSPLEVAMTAEGRTRAAAATYWISDVFRTVAMVIPVWRGTGLSGLMSGLAIVSLLRAGFTWAHVLAAEGSLWQRHLVKEQWRYAAPFGAAIALQVPQVYAHQFAVSSVVSPEAFAVYAVACFQLPLTHLLYTPISEVLMVKVGELSREGTPQEIAFCFQQAVARLSYAFIPLAIFSFVAAPELLGTLFGHAYLAAVPLYRVGVATTLLACFPVDGLLRAMGHTRHIFRVTLIKALLTVPLLWVGVTLFGMMGGMAVSLAIDLLGMALLLIGIPKALPNSSWAELLPWKEFRRASLSAVGAAIAVALARSVSGVHSDGAPGEWVKRILPLAMACGAFSGGYVASLGLLGLNPLRAIKRA